MVSTLGQHWGTRVAARRLELGITQVQLAALCDCTQQLISYIESGDRIPSDRLKVVVANRLGMDPGDLFAWPGRTELLGEGVA